MYPILQAALVAKGMSQRALAALLGKHRNTVSMMMRGILDFHLHDAIKIRDTVAPGTALDDLFFSDDRFQKYASTNYCAGQPKHNKKEA
jgi:transcriptional regulator with XRE-family HTH domain